MGVGPFRGLHGGANSNEGPSYASTISSVGDDAMVSDVIL